MKLQISDLKTTRQWRAATGLDKARFAQLLVLFTAGYLELFGQSVAARQTGLAVTPSLPSEEELLYFTLFSLKSGLTHDLLGVVCGMDGANAHRNQALGIKVLQHTLTAAGCLPKREFKDAEEFAEYLKNDPELIFDGLAQRTQRPGNNEEQKENYTGKKNAMWSILWC
jgi:hypothetical protein